MKCRDSAEARMQAQVNANRSGVDWVYFCDPSGGWHAERRDGRAIGSENRTWAGVEFCLVIPRAQSVLSRPKR